MPQLFVPSLGVFGFSEVVPFYVQISGSSRSLQDLLGPTTCSLLTIRVNLLRQIIVYVGQSAVKVNTVLAEGSLNPLPPAIFSHPTSASPLENALSWEGNLQLQNITTPTFDIAAYKVTVRQSNHALALCSQVSSVSHCPGIESTSNIIHQARSLWFSIQTHDRHMGQQRWTPGLNLSLQY